MTSLKSNIVVTYPVHVVLLNVTKELRRYLINDGHNLASLLPVSAFSTDDDERPRGDTDGKAVATQYLRDEIGRTFDVQVTSR